MVSLVAGAHGYEILLTRHFQFIAVICHCRSNVLPTRYSIWRQFDLSTLPFVGYADLLPLHYINRLNRLRFKICIMRNTAHRPHKSELIPNLGCGGGLPIGRSASENDLTCWKMFWCWILWRAPQFAKAASVNMEYLGADHFLRCEPSSGDSILIQGQMTRLPQKTPWVQ